MQVEYQQRDGDRENPVAERFHPALGHPSSLLGTPETAGYGTETATVLVDVPVRCRSNLQSWGYAFIRGGVPMTLVVHRAERSDALAAALADLLATPLGDVFAEEIIAVPARGI